jgi:integrase
VYRKVPGHNTTTRVLLGLYPQLSIEKARTRALAVLGQIGDGARPNDEKRKLSKETTLGQLFKDYMEKHSKPNKRSWKYDEREIPKFLGHWFNRKISAISQADVQSLHEKIRENHGLYQANRLLERLRGMYNRARAWGWEGLNPAQGIKKFPEKSRDRFLLPAEMQKFMKALDQEPNEVARDYVYLSLYTGARKSNVLAMRWEEIDWHRKVWRIPDTKNGQPLEVPLTSQAIAILKRRLPKKPAEWVFASRSTTGHYQDPKKAWERILATAKLTDLHIHDLRRTLGSYQAINGASSYIIGKSLGHKSQQSTQVYARLHLDPVRQSVQQAVNAMLKVSKR